MTAVPGVVGGFFAGLLAARWRMKLGCRTGTIFDLVSLLPLAILMASGFCGMAHATCRAHACPLSAVGMPSLSAFAIGYVTARVAFSRVHRDLIDAARLLGFGKWGVLFRVLIPAQRGTLFGGLILSLLLVAGRLGCVAGISVGAGALGRCAAAATALIMVLGWLLCVVPTWARKR